MFPYNYLKTRRERGRSHTRPERKLEAIKKRKKVVERLISLKRSHLEPEKRNSRYKDVKICCEKSQIESGCWSRSNHVNRHDVEYKLSRAEAAHKSENRPSVPAHGSHVSSLKNSSERWAKFISPPKQHILF